MDTEEFLRAVWPSKGYYAICSPLTVDEGTPKERVVYPARLYSVLEDVLQHVQLARRTKDLFFNVHTLVEFRRKGARKQDNARSCRVFFFDLDCGEDKDYPTQMDAVRAIRQFAKDVGLPKPMLVSSGRGVHAYFRMSRELNSSPEWLGGAYRLKALADHFGLKYDPSRTTDTSSLLRIPGSMHFKDRDNPLPVSVKADGEEIDTEDMLDIIESAFTQHKLSMRPSKMKPHSKLAGNLHKVWDGPPTRWQDVEAACPQIARQIFLRGDTPQPEWYWSMGVIRHTEDGEQACHDLFDGHPDYDPEMTDIKLAQLSAYGPTTCEKLADVCGPTNCKMCKYRDVVKSPIVAGRRLAELASVEGAPPPPKAVETDPDDEDVPRTEDGQLAPVVEAPWPFKRVTAGVSMQIKEEGAKVALPKIICRYDLFPLNHLAKTEAEGAQVEWCANLPLKGQVRFFMPMATLFDTSALGVFLSQEAILVEQDNLKHVRRYMSAYLQELQQSRKLQRQNDHLGWTQEDDFVLADVVIHPDGTETSASLSMMASVAKVFLQRKGTLQGQIDALKFYNEAQYQQHQFSIVCSLGSILMPATGQNGVVVNLSGESGASKSSALYAAASLWGVPKKYVLNGTQNGSTRNMRDELVATLSNLPFCMDEITQMDPNEARALAFNITQIAPKGRLNANSIIRTPRSGEKALIALTSANTSLQSLLAIDNAASDAGAMRVFELLCVKVDKKLKSKADKFMRAIEVNYGHIGPEFARIVTRHKAKIFKRVRKVMAELDEAVQAEGAERFWTACAACAIVACEIASKMGWLLFDPVEMRRWLIEDQIPSLRGVVKAEHGIYDPVNLLGNFINQHFEQIIVVRHTVKGQHQHKTSTVLQHARGRAVGHLNREEMCMHIELKAFHQWCRTNSKNGRDIVKQLHKRGVVTAVERKFMLGEGTEQTVGGHVRCFTVDMGHEEVGHTPLEDIVAKAANLNSNVIPLRKPKQS